MDQRQARAVAWPRRGANEGRRTERAPHFVLDATDGDKAIRIYNDLIKDEAGGVKGTGRRHPFTRYAIDTLVTRYTRRFKHAPDALEGSLAWSNKLNFQTEFYKLRMADMAPDQAAVEAVKKISFGKHRIAAGYSDFSVEIRGTEVVDLGTEMGKQRVPKKISVVARRSP